MATVPDRQLCVPQFRQEETSCRNTAVYDEERKDCPEARILSYSLRPRE
ncbi:MAG: hypothetical protein IJ636_08060 [Bacteroidales bacterium]|nr:hypothetical protein [Bacteroidales bacterium]